jgi:hypothetical protein
MNRDRESKPPPNQGETKGVPASQPPRPNTGSPSSNPPKLPTSNPPKK